MLRFALQFRPKVQSNGHPRRAPLRSASAARLMVAGLVSKLYVSARFTGMHRSNCFWCFLCRICAKDLNISHQNSRNQISSKHRVTSLHEWCEWRSGLAVKVRRQAMGHFGVYAGGLDCPSCPNVGINVPLLRVWPGTDRHRRDRLESRE